MAVMLDACRVDPKQETDACIIWLHGLGADGYDFVNVVPSLGLPSTHTIRFIFPHAPSQPVTINGGLVMPAWYDILGPDLDAMQDAVGIKKSEQAIKALLTQIMSQGIDSSRIILIGFSQGGALALHTALRFEAPLGGVVALSAYLPLHDAVMNERHLANQQIPIFMAHGFADPVVPYWVGQKSFQYLTSAGYSPSWHSYPIPHTVYLPELSDIGNWIIQRVGLKM